MINGLLVLADSSTTLPSRGSRNKSRTRSNGISRSTAVSHVVVFGTAFHGVVIRHPAQYVQLCKDATPTTRETSDTSSRCTRSRTMYSELLGLTLLPDPEAPPVRPAVRASLSSATTALPHTKTDKTRSQQQWQAHPQRDHQAWLRSEQARLRPPML
jgi:hypothetical protein